MSYLKYLMATVFLVCGASVSYATAPAQGSFTFHGAKANEGVIGGITCANTGNNYEWSLMDGTLLPFTGGQYNSVKKNLLNGGFVNTCQLYYPYTNAINTANVRATFTLRLNTANTALSVSNYEAVAPFKLPATPVTGNGSLAVHIHLPVGASG